MSLKRRKVAYMFLSSGAESKCLKSMKNIEMISGGTDDGIDVFLELSLSTTVTQKYLVNRTTWNWMGRSETVGVRT